MAQKPPNRPGILRWTNSLTTLAGGGEHLSLGREVLQLKIFYHFWQIGQKKLERFDRKIFFIVPLQYLLEHLEPFLP